MKWLTTLKILMTVLTVLSVAMFAALWMLLQTNNQTDENELGLAIAIALTLVITGIPGILLTVALAVTDICLFASKKKFGCTVASLVVLCVGLPIFAAQEIFNFALSANMPLLNILYVAALAAYVAAFVVCCIAVHKFRMQKRADALPVGQVEENSHQM